jgi:hypothetical protein
MLAMCGRYAVLAVGLLFTGTALASFEDDPAKPGTEARLAGILHEWELRSSAWKSLDVRYTAVKSDRAWRDKEPFSGRVVLLRNGHAVVETAPNDGAKQKSIRPQRLIWTDDAIHLVETESKADLVWTIEAKDRGRLPAVLALPFFWNLTAAGLKSRYSVELVTEKSETWDLRITPLPKTGIDHFEAAYIVLDRATYLPRRYAVLDSMRNTATDYRVTEVHSDKAVPDEVFRIPTGDGWGALQMEDFKFPSWLASQKPIELIP